MLTPNEGVVTVPGMERLGPEGLAALNQDRPVPLRILAKLAKAGTVAASVLLSTQLGSLSHLASGGIVSPARLMSQAFNIPVPQLPDLSALNRSLTVEPWRQPETTPSLAPQGHTFIGVEVSVDGSRLRDEKEACICARRRAAQRTSAAPPGTRAAR